MLSAGVNKTVTLYLPVCILAVWILDENDSWVKQRPRDTS